MEIYTISIEVKHLTKKFIRGPSLKKWLTVISPAIISLVTGLGVLFNYDTSLITGIVALITTFLGTLLGVSKTKRRKRKRREKSIE